jgi:hypothetical protein
VCVCSDIQDWPPRFDSYLKLKYFWFVFVLLNGVWVVIPFYIYCRTYLFLSKITGNNGTKKLR